MKLRKLLSLSHFVLLTLGNASTPLWAAAVSQNEFWVSALPNPNPLPHAGTIADPYDGSTASLFGSVMNSPNMPANCTIHLLGGTYMTSGNVTLQTGQKILGSGVDITTLVLTPTGGNGATILSGLGDGIEISDLTCDANAQNLASGTYGAISIAGSGAKIRRVKVKGVGATVPVSGIAVSGPQGVNADDVVVEDCVVMPPVNGWFCTAIAVNGSTGQYISARVSGNWVYGTNTTAVQCINLENSYNTLLRDNHAVNADSGVYSATAGNTNVTVVYNTFRNVRAGVSLFNHVQQNFNITGNTFELANVPGDWSAAVSLWIDSYSSGSYINEKIIGNTIEAYNAVGDSFYALSTDGATNLVIADNSIDKRFLWQILGSTNVILHDNVDLDGTFLSATNQIELPNSLTRTTVTASQYNAQVSDRYIGVTVSGALIMLPSPAGIPGKEFIIANETASGTVNVGSTAAPIHISGSSSLSLSPYTAMTFITDGTSWFGR